eukprot:XP_019930064.1 PREDICTED: uncharacterized protein LOC105346212 [Crassostrea gigas]
MCEEEIRRRYRFTKESIKQIVDMIDPIIGPKTKRSQALSTEFQTTKGTNTGSIAEKKFDFHLVKIVHWDKTQYKGKYVVFSQQCDNGQPLPNVFCGRGPSRQDCPSGYFCNIDPTDRFAVCCPERAPPIATCDIGKPLPNVFCGRGPNRQDCPSGYFCKIDPVDRFAICCKTNIDNEPKCQIGVPLRNVFCGRGPNRQNCPRGYSCNIHPADRYAVCCRNKRPRFYGSYMFPQRSKYYYE